MRARKTEIRSILTAAVSVSLDDSQSPVRWSAVFPSLINCIAKVRISTPAQSSSAKPVNFEFLSG